MRDVTSTTNALLVLATFAVPSLAKQDGVLVLPVSASPADPREVSGPRRRQVTAKMEAAPFEVHTLDITIGTPGQTVKVMLDTASDTLWVNPDCENSNMQEACRNSGRFDPSASSSFKDMHEWHAVPYVTGYAQLKIGNDSVTLGGATLNQVFGMATHSDANPHGILGASPRTGLWDKPYPTVLESLVEQGHIKNMSFGLDLHRMASDRGTITFGGIDTKRFSGPLKKLPIIPGRETPNELPGYWVYLDGMDVRPGNNGSAIPVFSNDKRMPAILDSGTNICIFPSSVVQALAKGFPSARKSKRYISLYEVDCSERSNKGTVDFTFGETVIRVEFKDFILSNSFMGDTCFLGMTAGNMGVILGSTFLTSAYVVHDLENWNIHIANSQDCGSDIVAIDENLDSIDSVVGKC